MLRDFGTSGLAFLRSRSAERALAVREGSRVATAKGAAWPRSSLSGLY
jgi:hypothetical protein